MKEIGDERFQARTWRWQRIGWAISASITAMAALGLFGDGPLSARTVRVGAYEVAYQSPVRSQAASSFQITRTNGSSEPLTIEFGNPGPSDLAFSPSPDSTVTTPTGVTPRFGPQVDRFEAQFSPMNPGMLRVSLIEGSARRQISFVVLP